MTRIANDELENLRLNLSRGAKASKTLNPLPFSPLIPAGPVSPIMPCFPCSPGGPMIPCVPFLPLVPLGPRLPRGPGGPDTQTFPGVRQTDPTIIDVTYLLIMCRISCIPTEPLMFTGSTLRRTIVPLYSVPLEKKIHLIHFKHFPCGLMF